MAAHRKKYIEKSSKYKYVYKYRDSTGNESYDGACVGKKKQGFKDERECALWVDKQLIMKGKEPINILIRK